MISSQTPDRLKIALTQLHPAPLDPEHNFATASAHIRTAAAQGAQLAVLPEYHLTGWEPNDPTFIKLAEHASTYLKKYQALAIELKIHIVPGTIVTTGPENELLNKSYFICAGTGEILGSYIKANLWHPERQHLTSGPDFARAQEELDELPSPHDVIQTPIGPVGLLICYDLAFPEAFRALVRQEANIIIIPTYTTHLDPSPAARAINDKCEEVMVRNMLVARAYENSVCVIFVNVGGPREKGFMGLSRVVMPLVGAVEGSFENSDEGVRVLDVDLGVLKVAEENYKVRKDLMKRGWHY